VFTEERLDAIRGMLDKEGRVVAAVLAREFGVSEDTIRRDLRLLADDGACRKVYGGAVVDAPDRGSLAERTEHEASAKVRLAKEAVKLIERDQTIFIDAGSTNLAIAAAIPRDIAVTVVTNAPGVVSALKDHPSANIVILGGLYNQGKGACLGSTTLQQLELINADLCFLGACGVHGETGITSFEYGEAEVKRAMVRKSRQLVVVATADKFPTVAPFQVAPPQSLHHLVVALGTDDEVLNPFVNRGTAVHLAA
jgi:DeoR/GlpR family transcriptional regulator of sugar metabolism